MTSQSQDDALLLESALAAGGAKVTCSSDVAARQLRWRLYNTPALRPLVERLRLSVRGAELLMEVKEKAILSVEPL